MAKITHDKPTLKDLELLVDLYEALKARPSVHAAAQELARLGWPAHPAVLYRTLTAVEAALWPQGGEQLVRRKAGIQAVSIPEKAERFFTNIRLLLELYQRTMCGETYDREAVTLGATNAVTTYHLPRGLACSQFLDKHPRTTIRVREGEYDDLLRWLAQGAVDLGMGPPILPRPGVEALEVCRFPRTLIFPPSHRFAALRKRRPFPLEELATETLLLLPAGVAPDFPVEQIPEPTGSGRRLTLPNMAEIRVWVKSGLGVALSNTGHMIPGEVAGSVASIDVSDQFGFQAICLYLPGKGIGALAAPAQELALAVIAGLKRTSSHSRG